MPRTLLDDGGDLLVMVPTFWSVVSTSLVMVVTSLVLEATSLVMVATSLVMVATSVVIGAQKHCRFLLWQFNTLIVIMGDPSTEFILTPAVTKV